MTCNDNVVAGSFRSLLLILRTECGWKYRSRITWFDKQKHVPECVKEKLYRLKSTSKLTIHLMTKKQRLCLLQKSHETFILQWNKNIPKQSLFFLSSIRNCSHFRVRHVAQVHPVQIAKPPPQHFGEGIKVASRFAMPADFTINYTM